MLIASPTLEVLSDAARRAARSCATSRSRSSAVTRLAIMGPSGSGKSTLLYILGALEPPTVGTRDPRRPGSRTRSREREQAAFRNRRIGFVFQDHSLLPQCSVLENVLSPTLVAPPGERDAGGDRARARALLAQVGLGRPARSSARRALGRREAARGAGARAHPQPVLLLCDEPTGNLDRAAADGVAALLLDLHARAADDPGRRHAQRRARRALSRAATR